MMANEFFVVVVVSVCFKMLFRKLRFHNSYIVLLNYILAILTDFICL